MNRGSSRPLIIKIGLVAASAVVSLLLAESVLRLLTRERNELNGMWTADETLGATLTPGFEGRAATSEFKYEIRINELGMRDGPVSPGLEAEEKVLMLGDSFVFGVGVDLEESVAKTLERRLEAEWKPLEVAVFNAGQPGSSTFQHLQILKRLGPILQPDYVVLVFFVGDDWFGNFPRAKPEEARRTLSGWLRVHSVLYRYLARLVFSRFREYDPYVMHRLEIEEGFQSRVDRVLHLLEEIRSTAHSLGSEFLVTINPRFSQVYDDAWSKAALLYGLPDSEYSLHQPNQWFDKELDQRDFWVLDLLGPFRREAQKRTLHFALDGHWNEEGNEFVAGLIAEEILSRQEILQTQDSSPTD